MTPKQSLDCTASVLLSMFKCSGCWVGLQRFSCVCLNVEKWRVLYHHNGNSYGDKKCNYRRQLILVPPPQLCSYNSPFFFNFLTRDLTAFSLHFSSCSDLKSPFRHPSSLFTKIYKLIFLMLETHFFRGEIVFVFLTFLRSPSTLSGQFVNFYTFFNILV